MLPARSRAPVLILFSVLTVVLAARLYRAGGPSKKFAVVFSLVLALGFVIAGMWSFLR